MNAARKAVELTLALWLASGPAAFAQAPLPGTAPLRSEGDLAAQMVDGINAFLLERTAESVEKRADLWNRDHRSLEDYRRSVASNRERFRKIIGAVDERLPIESLKFDATTSVPAQISSASGYEIFAVRWPVFQGVTAEGLLLQPKGAPVARVVALPDADWSPEMLVGLAPGVEPAAQFARRLAENGCQVVIPVLIDRHDTWSGIPEFRMTNQPHREFIYRMAFEVGRHVIGYEVQKVLAVVDWFMHENTRTPAPIGVVGYGEGGLLAFYSAAIDPRIQATLVSGYFQSRQELWKEPIYRDVWALLKEFGDAELASLVAPRSLVVEASRAPKVDGPPAENEDRKGATPRGRLTTPPLRSVEDEVARARPSFSQLKVESNLRLVVSDGGSGEPGSADALAALLGSLGVNAALKPLGTARPTRERTMTRRLACGGSSISSSSSLRGSSSSRRNGARDSGRKRTLPLRNGGKKRHNSIATTSGKRSSVVSRRRACLPTLEAGWCMTSRSSGAIRWCSTSGRRFLPTESCSSPRI